jgi:hypothetical protein
MNAVARGDVESVEDRAAADAVADVPNLNNGIAGLRRRCVRWGWHSSIPCLEGREE